MKRALLALLTLGLAAGAGAAGPTSRAEPAAELSLPRSAAAGLTPGAADLGAAPAASAPKLAEFSAAIPASLAAPLPVTSVHVSFGQGLAGAAERVRVRLEGQLEAMSRHLGGPDPIFDHVRVEGGAALATIGDDVAAGRVSPAYRLRTHSEDAAPAVPGDRPVRVGFYPVAADPFQWAHLLIGLRSMAEFKLDKVVYVLAGDDPRKPSMTPAALRHPMGQAVLETFAPFFDYSPIAVGTTFDGETNLFRTLSLNRGLDVQAVYLVGGDHYKLKDKNGNDDTLPKIEKRVAREDAGHDPARHSISVGFVSRGEEAERVPTTLDVRFLQNVPFEASSTLVRSGRLALMPYAAFDWALRHAPGLYGLKEASKRS